MKKKMRLQGLSFREELEGKKIDYSKKTIYLGLVPWEVCNWNCIYCHEDHRIRERNELTLDEISSIILEAGKIGIKSLLLLGGEILLKQFWPKTMKIVDDAFEAGLITVIYTNGSELTLEMANWLADRNVSIAIKVESLIEEKYEKLTLIKGSFNSTIKAINILKQTDIGKIVYESDSEALVRLLFTTVGNSMNISEYVALARFSTNHGARWMMEFLNHRGNALRHPELSLENNTHAEAMQVAMSINPEQDYDFTKPCRLFSCITIRKKGAIAVCPQDYSFLGNIRQIGSLEKAIYLTRNKIDKSEWREGWTGRCPIKNFSKFNTIFGGKHVTNRS